MSTDDDRSGVQSRTSRHATGTDGTDRDLRQRPAPKEWAASYFSPEPVQIEFLDSSGQHWTRNEQGFLTSDEGRHDTTST